MGSLTLNRKAEKKGEQTMRIEILRAWRALLLGFTLTGISIGGPIDWSMTLSPQSTNAISNQTIDFLITFANNSTQDIFFSDFGDGQGITVDLEGNVVGNGACGPGADCFVQNLFITSPDPIDIPAGSTGTTFDLGDLILGTHTSGGQITVVAKGGPDSLNGVFTNPAFSETTATVQVVPEPTSMVPFTIVLLAVGLAKILGREA
jgi:hypothetical protein